MAKRVLLGMSGGVDSSVAAYLLQASGYEVIGVTLKVWESSAEDGCCALSAVEDARRVAEAMGIKHYVLNYQEIFWNKVISPYIDDYLQGRTPSPCILCNRYIKFDHLLKFALSLDAEFLATGHYARIQEGTDGYRLRKAVDPGKDQTYFLYNLSQTQLAKILFPCGGYTKAEIREIARQQQLAVSEKKDSQEVCFIPDDDHGRFVGEHLPPGQAASGPIVDSSGKVLGHHQGFYRYTLGQRKGLGLALGERRYVVEIRPADATVVLGEEAELMHPAAIIGDVNFISAHPPQGGIQVAAKIRSQARPEAATVTPVGDGQWQVTFAQGMRALTPGQSIVFYQGDQVIGGGVISRVVAGEHGGETISAPSLTGELELI